MEEQKTPSSLFRRYTKWLKSLGLIIAAVLGGIISIVQFVQLWRGNQETITRVLWLGGTLLVLFSLYHVGFSKTLSPIKIDGSRWNSPPRRVYMFGDNLSKFARMVLFLILLGTATLWGISVYHTKMLEKKIIIAVADFGGPDPEKYRITEYLLGHLSNSLSKYDDVILIPLGEEITEQEGSKKAQELGKNYLADWVIWGWYGVTESDVLLSVHFENYSQPKYFPIVQTSSFTIQEPVENIRNFQIQKRLSSQLTYIFSVLTGLIHFEAGDYLNALDSFSDVIRQQQTSELYFGGGMPWFTTILPNGSRIEFGTWLTYYVELIIYVNYEKPHNVIGYSFEAFTYSIPPESNFHIKNTNISIGSSEEDLIREMGLPKSSYETTITMSVLCKKDIYYVYDDIGIRICEDNKLIHGIEVPPNLLEVNMKP